MASLTIFIVIASIFIPTLVAIGFLWIYRKWRDRDGSRSPIEHKVIFGAGEQLRKRVDDLTDSMNGGLTTLFFLGPYFLAAWALPKLDWARLKVTFGDWLLIAAFLLMAVWAVRRIIVHGNMRRRALAGLKAELYTAQELNRLIGMGCTVLHDVPGEGFNLDHVVIGPRGVYMVETKSVRKPKGRAGGKSHVVAYDGECLRFPNRLTREPLEQARRQAQWLSHLLSRAMGRAMRATPTVALPGWYIEGRATGKDPVRVFNPAGQGAAFMADRSGTESINVATAAVIAQLLAARYPNEG